jgi:hypothetical protein
MVPLLFGHHFLMNVFQVTDYSRITNIEDEIPIVPGKSLCLVVGRTVFLLMSKTGRFLGYHHSSGEKHIKYTGDWRACAGQ